MAQSPILQASSPSLSASNPASSASHPPEAKQLVYPVLSPRAGGLAINVNLAPDQRCNFGCLYCTVERGHLPEKSVVTPDAIAEELHEVLGSFGGYAEKNKEPATAGVKSVQQIVLTGDGEPTLCPCFAEIVQAVMHVRARRKAFVKVVLNTNATRLHLPAVQEGLRYFTLDDEVWAKLDAGTQAYMDRINGPGLSLQLVLQNIRSMALRRPVIIQTLFASINRTLPSEGEVKEYSDRLRELKEAGARIVLVQIFSVPGKGSQGKCEHLPLQTLSQIAQKVRLSSGLNVKVF